MKHAQCVKKGQRLVTLCKNKWCDESSHIVRHLHLSSTEHEDSDPAKQFTQNWSASYTGPQCRHLQRSSRQAGTKTVGSITLLALSAASCYTQRQWLNYLGPSSQSMGHIFLCSAGIVGVVAGSLAWFPCPWAIKYAVLQISERQSAVVKSSLFLWICLNWRLNQECCHKADEQWVPVNYRSFQRKTCKLKKVPSNHLTADRLRGF